MSEAPKKRPATSMRNTCAGALHTPDGKVPPGVVFYCTAAQARYYLGAGLAERVKVASDGHVEAVVSV